MVVCVVGWLVVCMCVCVCACVCVSLFKLSFGGIPLPGKPGTFLHENFHGCIENLNYNGVTVIDMAKRRKPQIYTVVRSIAVTVNTPFQYVSATR